MTLLEAVRAARQYWMTIVACVLIGIGVAAVYALLQPRLYTATSRAYVIVGAGSTRVADASIGANVAEGKAKSYVSVMASDMVAERVIAKLGLDIPNSDVTRALTVSVEPETPTIIVQATSTSPVLAREFANAAVESGAEVASILESGGKEGTELVKMVPVSTAEIPSQPSSPNVQRLLAYGFLGGVALAWIVVLLKMRLDTRIRRPSDIAQMTEVALIGTIPRSRDLTTRLHSEDMMRGAVGEALRHLRTNLMFADPDNPPRTVLVTSPQPSEGKSTTSALLARALAMRGERVLLIDADLRRPMVGTIFGVTSGIGLTQALSGSVPLDEAIVETDTPGLNVLPAGRIPHNPSEILGSARFAELLTELAATYLVIIDAPPLLPVTDGLILSRRVDGLLLVTLMGKGRREHLDRALQLLAGVHARVFGIVLNGIPQGRSAGVYGYETYGGYEANSRRTFRKKAKGEKELTRSGR